MTTLITIITATHNLISNGREKTFRQCVESIHQENQGQIEHLVIDGGSTDGSVRILDEYAKKGWLKYISEPDNGIYDAMNKGVRLAQSEYVWFINSDDYILNGSVNTILEQADFGKVDAFITGDTKHRHAKYAIDHDIVLIDVPHHVEVIMEERVKELLDAKGLETLIAKSDDYYCY